MAYTINLTDGSIFATVSDGTINTSSSMILVGKNYAGYGEFLDENFIHLLENGANTSAPGAPLTGQLWWDSTNSLMKVYTGTAFKTISAATASATAPTGNVIGDIWFDTTNQQLKVWNGSAFILVGPASSSGQGTSGAIVTTIEDSVGNDHVVIQMFVANTIVSMVSKDSSFTPAVGIAGFATIAPGIQMSTTVSNAQFVGTAANASLLDGLDSTSFLRSDASDTTSGTLGIINDSGLTVGLDQDAKISVTQATSAVNIQNQTQDANINIQVSDGGVTTTALFVDGSTALVGVKGITNLGSNAIGNIGSSATTFNTVFASAIGTTGITNIGSNAVGNIGSSSSFFNTIFATATTALYADVAERFAADNEYEAGTVVELGGTAEITKSVDELSENVFGVISTRAAYLMNAGAGPDSTHPPIAMTGRVPVRVTGSIRKGDRLVAAGDGLARAARAGEATAFNTIGRSLEAKESEKVGIIEAIVTIN